MGGTGRKKNSDLRHKQQRKNNNQKQTKSHQQAESSHQQETNEAQQLAATNAAKKLNKQLAQKRRARQRWWHNNGKKLLGAGIVAIVVTAVVVGIVMGAGGKESSGNNTGGVGNVAKPMLIEIGSTSCEPCRLLQPILTQVKNDYGHKVDVKIYDSWNTTVDANMANKYNVTTIPTMIFLDKNGKEMRRLVGYHDYNVIVGIYEELGWI